MDNWKPNSPSTLQSGLSLIGVLVAVLLLSSGSLAIAQLMARTENTVGISQEKFVASNVAREGLELVQAARDNNWFTGDALWTEGICDTASSAAYPLTIEPATAAPGGIAVTPNVRPGAAETALYVLPDGRWTHAASPTAQKSPYSRSITVDCRRQYNLPNNPEPAAIVVTATVTWQSRGRAQSVAVVETLYNWLPSTQGTPGTGGPASCPTADPVAFALLDVNPKDDAVSFSEADPIIQEGIAALSSCREVASCIERFDINRSGTLTPLDVLMLINVRNACGK